MTERRLPLDAALDLVLYAPLGLMATVGEELPRLAAKGRSRVGAQVGAARLIGRFAVGQGRLGAGRFIARSGVGDMVRGRGPDSSPAPSYVESEGPGIEHPVSGFARATRREPAAEDTVPAAPLADAGSEQDLAIPGYDSLSASQVVQRLAGLTPEERKAVYDYESAHRARRTILTKVVQLGDG